MSKVLIRRGKYNIQDDKGNLVFKTWLFGARQITNDLFILKFGTGMSNIFSLKSHSMILNEDVYDIHTPAYHLIFIMLSQNKYNIYNLKTCKFIYNSPQQSVIVA